MVKKGSSEIRLISCVYLASSYLLEIFLLIAIAVALMPVEDAGKSYMMFKLASGRILLLTAICTVIFYVSGEGLMRMKRWALYFAIVCPTIIGVILLYFLIKNWVDLGDYAMTLFLFLSFIGLATGCLVAPKTRSLFK